MILFDASDATVVVHCPRCPGWGEILLSLPAAERAGIEHAWAAHEQDDANRLADAITQRQRRRARRVA